MNKSLLLIGFGNCARCLLEQEHGYGVVFATTREPSKFKKLTDFGASPLLLEAPPTIEQLDRLEKTASRADVLVSFPPEPTSDRLVAASLKDARKVVYISSTGVYGQMSGAVDQSTPVDRKSERAKSRLDAEDLYLELPGAVVLRAPALYGPEYGLHKSLLSGKYRLPGDGSTYSSRIHLTDMARIILRVFETDIKSGAYLVGDSLPASKIEVATWLAAQLSLSLPESVPIQSVHHTLRADRRVDGSRLLELLGIELLYPSYKEGFKQCLIEFKGF